MSPIIKYFKSANCVSACDIVNPKKLGPLLYLSVMQHIFNVQHPGIDLSAPITMDEVGKKQVHLLFRFAFFGPHGKDRKMLCSFRYDRC